MHQLDLYPAVSMLHVLYYKVKSYSLKRGKPWFGQTACTPLANSFYFIYTVYLAESDTGLCNKPQVQSLIHVYGVFQHAGDSFKKLIDNTNF